MTSYETVSNKGLIDESVKVAEDFVRLYYKTLEQRPHRLSLLYLDSAVVIWDGNPKVGTEAVQKFFEDLPSVTFCTIGMDTHPVSSAAVGQQKSFLVNISGTFRTPGPGGGPRSFLQNFVIIAENTKWKVASDIFRTQHSPNEVTLS